MSISHGPRAKVALLLAMGFSSGLPFFLIGSTLQAWMTELQVNLKTIGVFGLVGLPYTLKFLWAPLLDRFPIPVLGRLRGWMLLTQVLGLFLTIAIGLSDPLNSPVITASLCFLLAFVAATQDVVIDGYRAEVLSANERGTGAATGVIGYRIGMLYSGAGALWLAASFSWPVVYGLMAAGFGVGIIATLLSDEPIVESCVSKEYSIKAAFVAPLKDLLRRAYIGEIALLILIYKLGEAYASSLLVTFILSDGYSKVELANIQKFFGLLATIFGSIAGAAALPRLGLHRALLYFGVLQALPLLGLTYLAMSAYSLPALVWVIGLENFTGGMATVALTALCMAMCKKEFSATHYAVLSSIASLSRTTISATSGFVAAAVGWESFFVICTVLTVPSLILLTRFKRWQVDG